MKKTKLLMLGLLILFIVLTVSAGILDIINNVEKTNTLSKVNRDIILLKSSQTDIDISIEIVCEYDGYPDSCVWSATQEGIINTHDNIMDRWYNDSVNMVEYTTEELIDLVNKKIKARLDNYADALIQRESIKTVQATGNIIYNEEK